MARLALALLLVLAVGSGDAAVRARLALPDVGVVAGAPSTATVRGADGAVRVVFARGATRVTASARRGALRFVLPRAGAWRYRILAGGRVAGTGSVSVRPARLSGAKPYAVCAAAGEFWPVMTLALGSGSLWVACRHEARVLRIDPATGAVRARIALRGAAEAYAVAAGLGAVWVLDSQRSNLYRIDPARNAIVRTIPLGAGKAYNVWVGPNAVWVADDGRGQVLRIDPTGGVTDRIDVGDGPSDLAFAGDTAWVVNHRDRGLVRIDTASRRARRLTTLPGDAPERLVRAAGSLWVTGRGTDLVRVSESTGAVLDTIDVDASGIDVVAGGDTIWVPARTAAVDQSGFPTMGRLFRIRAGSAAPVGIASGRLDVHGLVADERAAWLADNRAGVLYRVPG